MGLALEKLSCPACFQMLLKCLSEPILDSISTRKKSSKSSHFPFQTPCSPLSTTIVIKAVVLVLVLVQPIKVFDILYVVGFMLLSLCM